MDIYKITPDDIKDNIVNLHQIVFEVTDMCNLRCEYCIYSGIYNGFDKRANKKLSFDKAKIMLDYLFDLWSDNKGYASYKPTFVGFYGGEPLLNIDLIKKIISYIEEKSDTYRKFIYTMTTNALLLDKYMDYLADKNVVLTISLDGDSEGDSYRKTISGKKSFDIVFDNVKMMRDKYPEYFSKFVNFNSVLTNKNSLDKICDFFSNEFNKIPRISELNNSNIKEECKPIFDLMFKSKRESLNGSHNQIQINEKLFLSSPKTRTLANYIFYNTGNVYNAYNDLFIDKNKSKIVPTGTCTPFLKKIFLTVNGKIIQCERISSDYTLGCIDNNGIKLDFQEISDKFNFWVDSFKNQCKSCFANKSCYQCIYQIDSMRKGKFHCPAYYTKEKYDKYVDINMKYLKDNPSLYEILLKDIYIN